MTKKVLTAALFVILAIGLVWAGDKKATMDAGKMEAMKAEMMKCAVCKNMAEVMPVIKPEAVKLDNGMAIVDRVTDPKMVGAFHAACDKMGAVGATMTTMTDEQAKTDLCEFCQGMRSAMKAGAQMSHGKTKNGGMMVLTSTDPAVQAQIATLHEKCAAMMSQMDMPMEKTTAEKKKY